MVGFYFPDGNDEFEYDVRGLITSFFPGAEAVKLQEKPDAETALAYEQILAIPSFPEIRDKSRTPAFILRLPQGPGMWALPTAGPVSLSHDSIPFQRKLP